MFKTPKTNDITAGAAFVGGAVAGGLVSDGVVNAVPAGTVKVKRFVILLLSIIAASSVKATDTLSKTVQGVFTGMAVTQGTQLVREVIAEQKPEVAEGQNGAFLNGVLRGSKGMGNPWLYANNAQANGNAQALLQQRSNGMNGMTTLDGQRKATIGDAIAS